MALPPKLRIKTPEEQIAEYEARLARAHAMNAAYVKKHYFTYAKVLRAVRLDSEHFGQLARIAIFKEGTKKENKRRATSARQRIQAWLYKNHKMQKWQIRMLLVPDTWGQFEIQVAYLGEYESEKEADEARAERFAKAGWEIRRGKAVRKR